MFEAGTNLNDIIIIKIVIMIVIMFVIAFIITVMIMLLMMMMKLSHDQIVPQKIDAGDV